jgi:hypothetical protein
MSDHSANESQNNQPTDQTDQLSPTMIANALEINAQAQKTMSSSYHSVLLIWRLIESAIALLLKLLIKIVSAEKAGIHFEISLGMKLCV